MNGSLLDSTQPSPFLWKWVEIHIDHSPFGLNNHSAGLIKTLALFFDKLCI
jgi:hypothetical protein